MIRTMLKWGLVAAAIAAAAQLAPGADNRPMSGSRVMPVTNFTPIVVARDKGFFADGESQRHLDHGAAGRDRHRGGVRRQRRDRRRLDLRADGRARQRPRYGLPGGQHAHPLDPARQFRAGCARGTITIKERQRPGRQENLGRPDQRAELRPHARVAAAQRRRPEHGASSWRSPSRRWPTPCSRSGSTQCGMSSRS